MNLQKQTRNKLKRLRQVAWVNVVTQLAFPLAGAYSTSVHAQTQVQTSLNQLMSVPVVPYTLGPGETVATVAKQQHLTVAQLEKLNEFRTFSKPFTALGAGDELDVPKDPLQSGRSPFAVDREPVQEDGETGRTVAGAATRAAGLLGTGHVADAAAGQLTGMAAGEASAQLNKWLQRYGTARVQANIDQHGNLEGSQFDMLLPLYDAQSDMAFTQYGLRRIDKRTTANLGLGHRHFFNDWMLGYNAFVDRDLTRAHTRAGLGLEYARDYLRLSTNGYMRLTGWKDSPDLEDYRERPANGFDLRAEGWLPALPQLGGKLMYEQYFGDEVGLFGHDNRQKDPHAVTAGLSYTPVPLLTVGVDRRQGTSGNGETLFNLGVNYEIGTPWAKQISPDSVGSRRTLAGGRYDLVERNNQIVLEYQKKEVISLGIPAQISGKSGQTLPLNTSVTSKYGLAVIDWQAPELLAAGGRVIDNGNGHYSLLLPQVSAGKQQTFTLSGVARDTRGNLSRRATAEVVVAYSAISVDNSTFSATTGGVPADGRSKTTLRLTLKDQNGNPLTGQAGSISFDKNTLPGQGTDPTFSNIREVSPGVYEVDVTAGTKEGTLTVTPVVDGIRMGSTDVVFDTSAHTASADNSIVKVTPEAMVADGASLATLTVTLRNIDGDLMKGKASDIHIEKNALTGEGADATLGEVKESTPGVYTVVLKAGTLDGNVTLTPVVNGVRLNPAHVILEPAAVPAVTDLKLSGKLEVGETLKGSYTFNADGGDTTDKSAFLWGSKGTTAEKVGAEGKTVSVPGQTGDYVLKETDAGKVLELSVQAKNGKGTTGNVATLGTDAPSGNGNNTTGGNGAGGVVAVMSPEVHVNKTTARKGESISLTVDVKDSQGQMVPDAPVLIRAVSATNRQNVPETPTLLVDGGKTWSGVTGSDGKVTVNLTDPNGIGVKSLLKIEAGYSGKYMQQSVIFTVITSPDSDKANFYGHMADEIVTSEGVRLKRPPLYNEVTPKDGIIEAGRLLNGETYAWMQPRASRGYCSLPSSAQLKALALANPGGQVTTRYGWPSDVYYNTSTPSGSLWTGVQLANGAELYYADAGVSHPMVSCLR